MDSDDLTLTESELDEARAAREETVFPLPPEGAGVETTQPGGAASATPISGTAFDLIVEFEVSSEQLYTRKYRGPIWPGGASGVTIGIGYDVGYATRALLAADFGGEIPDGMIAALGPAIGLTGAAAQNMARRLAGSVDVPWAAAIGVHRRKVVPRWVGLVERSLPRTGEIGPDCLGALVSLTYNRGPSFNKRGDRYAEMRSIRNHMSTGNFRAVPGDIRAMKRLWPTVPGLQKRREREARLFERGLQA